ncbi:MAG: FkbM family methyltransferase [Actinomycetota bacterium]
MNLGAFFFGGVSLRSELAPPRETPEVERAREVPLWLFRLVPPPLYHRLRRAPVIGSLVRAAFDTVIPRRGLVLARVRSGALAGMVLEVDPRMQIDAIVDRYEVVVRDVMLDVLQDGDTAVDIGAHLGYFTLVMAMRVKERGRVVAFEPDPTVMQGLERNVKRNGAQTGAGILVVSAAVDRHPGRLGFVEGRETSRGRLVEGGGDVEVEVMTLDDIALRFGAPRLVKIDVEGRELGVLQGGADTLAARATVFIIEAHGDELERACVNLLESYGYGCGILKERGRGESYVIARHAEAGSIGV